MSELLTRYEAAAVSATFNGRLDSLPQVARTLVGVDALWGMCADLAVDAAEAHQQDVDRQIRAAVREPYVQLRKQSPLWLEVTTRLSEGLVVTSALGFFAWLLKNPASIAGFLPAFKEHWHHGWHRAEVARNERMSYMFHVEQVAAQIEAAEPGDVEASDAVPDFGKVTPDEFWSPES